jgi:alkylhydroperoxidase domain protein
MTASHVDVIDALAGVADGSTVARLRRERAAATEHAQGSYRGLFDPDEVVGLTRGERFEVAVRVAEVHASAVAAGHFRERLGASAASERLPVLLRHAELLGAHPRDATLDGLQALANAGLSTREIVTLSQLIAFVSFFVRVLRALELLGADGVAAARARPMEGESRDAVVHGLDAETQTGHAASDAETPTADAAGQARETEWGAPETVLSARDGAAQAGDAMGQAREMERRAPETLGPAGDGAAQARDAAAHAGEMERHAPETVRPAGDGAAQARDAAAHARDVANQAGEMAVQARGTAAQAGETEGQGGDAEGRATGVAGARGARVIWPAEGLRRPTAFTVQQLGWMPWLEPLEMGEATAEQRAALEGDRAKSAYFRLLALDATVLRERTLTDRGIFYTPGGAPRQERELAAAATSRLNGCIYCTSVHARLAAQLSKRDEDIDRLLRLGVAPGTQLGFDARWQAVVDAAVALAQTPPALTAEHVERLRLAGLQDLEIFDALHAGAFFAWANRLMLTLGEPYFEEAAGA